MCTSITKLPTLGMESIETLTLQNVFTLKEIPSVMNFKKIQTAYLTYPYHCCAFKFPQTHKPKEFERHQIMERYCGPETQGMVPSVIVDSLKPSAAHQPLYVSLYRVTQESATHYARKLFALFDDNDYTTSSETSHDTSYNYITRRHMGSESSFGHVRSAGTRSPPLDTSTFYGQIIYESNYTYDYNGLALQQDGPTGATTGPMMSSTHKPSEMKDPMDPWGSSLLPSIKSDNKPVNTENGIFKPAVNVSTRIPTFEITIEEQK
ncbi:unnamed protein product [Medioppia subpectinata]|uniref:Uncharacterized protein n=1 Tax=Medioppia subpectinata TaxID=1979941 RepID=A0A7R9KTB6_9ACAR|nr:unnamed protein product [Medioppia subpectinata]CAG2108275.1 unnamed protein product [Medioppia subpectinata]